MDVSTYEFKGEEQKAELARKRKYTNKVISKRRIPVDLAIPLLCRKLYNAVNNFFST